MIPKRIDLYKRSRSVISQVPLDYTRILLLTIVNPENIM